MKEYDVKITETLEKTVTVQAESHDAAEEQVRAAYYNSEYILDSENFTGVAFGTTEERGVQKEQADTMNVLLVKPFMYPQAVQIGCELEDLQKAVGGDIEATYPFNEPVALVMHDEGKLVGKDLNRALRDDDGDIYDIIAGDFLVVGLGEDDFCSLSPELMKQFEEHFHQPETFVRMGRSIMALPLPDDMVKKEDAPVKADSVPHKIRPLIGDMKLEDVTPRIMDKYYRDLLSVKAVSSKYVKARTEYLTPHTVREVHKTLRNAFNQAVKWELMTRNPVEHATLPKEEHKTRDIWTAEVLQKALEACDDDILRLAINLAFSCSLRMGELLGLTWDCIDISPTSIELGQASIFVEKELQRVNREAMADLDGKDIMFKFPPTFASTHTALVLKTPKTKTSVRKVFLPKTVAEMLVQRKADIEELKDLFGDEFVDFNLVFCSSNGKPIEGQVINRAFNKLIEEKGLPKVVFHSLRHSSITYKLKLNGGDMKSVQGDSGHAQVKMVADVYSHIIDDDRRLNAERMEAAFYSGRQATPEPVQPAATESSADDKELLLKLLQNPEMAALLKSLAKTL